MLKTKLRYRKKYGTETVIYTITHIIYPLVELKSFYRNLEVLVKEVLLLSFQTLK